MLVPFQKQRGAGACHQKVRTSTLELLCKALLCCLAEHATWLFLRKVYRNQTILLQYICLSTQLQGQLVFLLLLFPGVERTGNEPAYVMDIQYGWSQWNQINLINWVLRVECWELQWHSLNNAPAALFSSIPKKLWKATSLPQVTAVRFSNPIVQ